MAVRFRIETSQAELDWYRESSYWMRVSDEKTMKNAAKREGKAEGFVLGKTKTLEENARNLYANGSSVEYIDKCLKMTEDRVREIVKDVEVKK